MKRMVLCLMLAVSLSVITLTPQSHAAKSPVSQGSRIVAGAITFDSKGGAFYEDENGRRESEWRLFPSGGYFVRDKVAVSLILEVASIKQGKFLDQIWAVGPGAKYYFGGGRQSGGTYYFVGGAYLFGQYIHDSGVSEDPREHYSLQSIKMDTGMTYMLSEAVGATIALFYDLTWVKQKEPENADSWMSGNNFGFEFGFTTFLF
ncbi:hypothetical protein ACFL2Z_03785 [Candidatus Eisenbacteria bacterium]|uniref:Outer membrane protein beta-barrel domain-containing protein n=1 Tax=Eiseniibacteriota bacterium TaxID=2212470 RepID=A0ABV6YPN1_UNCEI